MRFHTTEARTERLWMSNTGRVACDDHGGEYLRAAVTRDSHAVHHTTPLDAWLAATTDDAPGIACEECRRNTERPDDVGVGTDGR